MTEELRGERDTEDSFLGNNSILLAKFSVQRIKTIEIWQISQNNKKSGQKCTYMGITNTTLSDGFLI